jgi:S-adenosylmethionine-dependent methyltransferase
MEVDAMTDQNRAGQDVPPSQAGESETSAVRAFYDRIVTYEFGRLDNYILEYAVVQHYLTRFLPPPPATILDIGGGPGRYALLLAERGYTLTLLDLAPANVAWANQQFTQRGLNARAETGDARDLSRYADGTFDAALLLGPLYHLSQRADRERAVREARRVLRPGGLIFSMMLTLAAAFYEGFNRWPEGILQEAGVQQLLATGSGINFERDPHDFEGVYFARPEEVVPLHAAGQGFRPLVLAGCEGVLGGRREALAAMPPEVQAGWVRLMLQICEESSILGASERLLFVGEAAQDR